MVNLTKGKSRGCKDSIGGLNEVYLFPFVEYSRSQIVRTDLVLTSFPPTTIYRFYTTNQPNFLNDGKEDEGGKFYSEDISLEFSGLDVTNEFRKFLRKDFRAIIRDRNGVYRLLGAYNGLESERLSATTGNSKISFSGYKTSFSGIEEQPSLFINNLEDAGFTISTDNFLLAEDGELILTEDNQFIIIEE